MHSSDIAARASFDHIRYAQLWEDADVLTEGLGDQAGGTLVSICSAGDNALAMLTLDPARVVVVDLSPAQIACLRLRMGAFRALDHAEFLELMGARPSERRKALLARVAMSELCIHPLHPAGRAVDGDGFAVADPVGRAFQPDHAGDAQFARDDGGMRQQRAALDHNR